MRMILTLTLLVSLALAVTATAATAITVTLGTGKVTWPGPFGVNGIFGVTTDGRGVAKIYPDGSIQCGYSTTASGQFSRISGGTSCDYGGYYRIAKAALDSAPTFDKCIERCEARIAALDKVLRWKRWAEEDEKLDKKRLEAEMGKLKSAVSILRE